MHPTPDPARYKKRGRGCTHAAPSRICHEAKTKVKCHTIIQQENAASECKVDQASFPQRRDHVRVLPVPLSLSRPGRGALLERSCATPPPPPPTPVYSSLEPRWARPPAAWRTGRGLSCCAPPTWM